MKIFKKTALSAFIAMAVLASFATIAFCGNADEKKPSIYIGEKTVNMGLIYEERDVSHDFVVENRGNAELHILRIKAG